MSVNRARRAIQWGSGAIAMDIAIASAIRLSRPSVYLMRRGAHEWSDCEWCACTQVRLRTDFPLTREEIMRNVWKKYIRIYPYVLHSWTMRANMIKSLVILSEMKSLLPLLGGLGIHWITLNKWKSRTISNVIWDMERTFESFQYLKDLRMSWRF